MAEEYSWLVYMAGENSLQDRVEPAVTQMAEGLSEILRVAIEADLPDERSKFVVLEHNEAPVIDRLRDNPNVGSPATLSDFLKRGRNGARHHVVCIWSHGYGWIGTAFDEADRRQTSIRDSRKALMVASRGLFRTSVETTVQEADRTEVDEAGRDFLDMAELRAGLRGGLVDRKDKFAIIGCDACYMAMLEVAYEVRNEGEILVASEEEEEPAGWNYKAVFGKFAPGDNPEEAAAKIVQAYEPQTLLDPRATLSAIKLDEMDEVAEAVDALGARLTPLIHTPRFAAIKTARAKVHTFKLYHYIDLLHFAECLKAAFGNDKAVEDVLDAADDVIKAVKGAVLATMNGAKAENAHGLAVYLPNEPVNAHYGDLTFVQRAPRWAEFVTAYGANR
jgi:hypothetical protein